MSSNPILQAFQPFQQYLPEVIQPTRPVPFKQKVIWTVLSLMIFLIMSEIPLYGIMSNEQADPLYWLRAMTASNRGTLMELGISPIVTSSMIFQFLTGAQILTINRENKKDVELFEVASKVVSILLTIGQALVVVISGSYGKPSDLGIAICLLQVLQLVFATLTVFLLDELMNKGYGLGSGISLFTTTNIIEQIFWKIFAPTTVNSGRGTEFEGAIISFFHLMIVKSDKKRALVEAFYRENLPNLFQVIATVLVFVAVLYLQGFRYEIPVKSNKQRGSMGAYPIKLFYSSSTPLMLQSALTSNVFLISQLLYAKFPTNFVIRLLGVWGVPTINGKVVGSNQKVAIGGLSYYLQPPLNSTDALMHPVKTLLYIAFVLGTCAVFSVTWSEISGTSAKDITKQFKQQGMVITGQRETSVGKTLKKIIPTAAVLGGISIGALSVGSDLLGTLGSGSNILMASTTVYGFYEKAVKEGGLSKKKIVNGFNDLL